VPVYEYRCPKCEDVIEILFFSHPHELPKCRRCDLVMIKIISKGSFVVKGFNSKNNYSKKD
jgi:putative FmdB family regulatory protein